MKKLWHKLVHFFKFVLKDKLSRWIFVIVYLLMSSPIWICYILEFIFKNGVFASVGTAYWLFWAGPFTPFIGVCLGITAGVRAIIDRIIKRKQKNSVEK